MNWQVIGWSWEKIYIVIVVTKTHNEKLHMFVFVWLSGSSFKSFVLLSLTWSTVEARKLERGLFLEGWRRCVKSGGG